MEEIVAAAMAELREGLVEIEERGAALFEVSGAEFGDKRLNNRYPKVLGQMMKMPQAPLNQSADCLSEMHAAYRFISNKKVTVEKLLEPHRNQIAKRAQGAPMVLAIQDMTRFDLSDHLTMKGLKPSSPGKIARALCFHTALFALPNGLPLGIGYLESYSGKKECAVERVRAGKWMDEKITGRWLRAIDAGEELFEQGTRVIWLSDRESDIYEVLHHIEGVGKEFVIRARVSRGIEEGPHHDTDRALEAAPVVHRFELKVRGNFKGVARTAQVELRYIKATITVPLSRMAFVERNTVATSVVEVREVNAAENVEPLHWQLITNLPVTNVSEAVGIVELYARRWAIEEVFKILKSGCRADRAQFQTIERFTKYVALSLIVAWRIYYLVHINRVAPEAPAESVVTRAELETLQLLLDAKRKERKMRRVIIKTANQVITEVAKLGGYLNRKSDPCPGTVVLWRGTMALAVATMTFLARKSLDML